MRKILVLTMSVCVLCLSPVAQAYAASLYATGPIFKGSALDSFILVENRDLKYPVRVYVKWYSLNSSGNTLFESINFVLNPNSASEAGANLSGISGLYAVEVGLCGPGAAKTTLTHVVLDSTGNTVPDQRVLNSEFTKSNTFVCPP